jgi:hypothetical protein
LSREAIDDLKTEEGTVVAYFGVARELREAGREGRRERERERIDDNQQVNENGSSTVRE